MESVESAPLYFRSAASIALYLSEHKLLESKRAWLIEKKVIQAVAKYFSNSEKQPMVIKFGVTRTLSDLGLVPQKELVSLLTKALSECPCSTRRDSI